MADEGAVPRSSMPYVDTGVLRVQEQHDKRIGSLETATLNMHNMVLEIHQATAGLPDRLRDLSRTLDDHVGHSEARSKDIERDVRSLQDAKLIADAHGEGKAQVVNVFMRGLGMPIIRYVVMFLLGGGLLWWSHVHAASSAAAAVEKVMHQGSDAPR